MPAKLRTIFTSLWITVTVFLCSLFFWSVANAATLSLSPATGNYTTQNNFTVSVEVNTNQAINGVEGSLQFPTNKLEVIGLDKSKSVMSIWIQEPSFSNGGQTGLVQFSAIKLNPGFVGSRGNVLNVIFRVKDAGVANVVFASGAVLANDGKGTNILDAFGSSVFTLTRSAASPTTSSSGGAATTVPVQKSFSAAWPQIKHWTQDANGKDVLFTTSDDAPRWTASAYAKLSWSVPDGASSILTALDDNPDSELTGGNGQLIDSQILPFLTEGKHYFHLRFVKGNESSPTLHFPLLVDFSEPKHFNINFEGEETTGGSWHSTSSPRPRLRFFSSDELSGLDHYEFKINNGDWTAAPLEQDGTFILPKLEAETRYDLAVRAFDLAGNFTDAASALVVQPIVAPAITYYPRNVWFSTGPLTIEGKSAPEARIEVVLKRTEEPLVITTKADANGDWRVIYSEVLPAGTYTVKVRQILDNGAASQYSPTFTIRLDSWLGKILLWLEKFYWYALLLFFVVVQAVLLYYYRRAVRRLNFRSLQQLDSSANSIYQDLAALEKQGRAGASPEQLTARLNQLQKKILNNKNKIKVKKKYPPKSLPFLNKF